MKRWSPTFSVPGVGFVEGGFPTDQRGEDRFRVILRRSAHPRSLTFTIHSRVHAPVRVHRHGWSDRSETREAVRAGEQLDADGAVPARCCGPACNPDPSRPSRGSLDPDLVPARAEQMLAVLFLWRLYRVLLPAPSLGSGREERSFLARRPCPHTIASRAPAA